MEENENNLINKNEEIDVKNIEVEFDDKTLQESVDHRFDTKKQVEPNFFDIDLIQAQLLEHMGKSNITYDTTKANLSDLNDHAKFNSLPVVPENSNVEYISPSNTTIIKTEDSNIEESQSQEKVELPQSEEDTAPLNLPQPVESAQLAKPANSNVKIQEGEKKYIIYVDADNVKFMEQLTIRERNILINRFLREQDENIKKRREVKELSKFTNQVIVMVFTVIIALPLFFVFLNKSIEVTILNYQQAQQNFVKLYKEQGKIKNYKSFQKNFL